jgi:hypothetical protein
VGMVFAAAIAAREDRRDTEACRGGWCRTLGHTTTRHDVR